MTKISIFGGIHVDNPEVTEKEFRDFCPENVEAIFLEEQGSEPSDKAALIAMILFPTYFFGVFIYVVVSVVIRLIVGTSGTAPEKLAAKKVADERNIPIYGVDVDIWKMMADLNKLIHVPINWLLFSHVLGFKFIIATGLIVESDPSTLYLIVIHLAILAVGLIIFAYLTYSERDRHMVSSISRISKANQYNEVCLVVGRKHAETIPKLLDDYELELKGKHTRKFLRKSE